MSTKLYCYERGACRGDEFTNRVILSKKTVIDNINTAIELKRTDEDDYDTFMDSLFDGDNYTESNVMYALINGSDCSIDKPVTERLDLITNGKSFTLEMEESTMGFGASKQSAKLAYIAMEEEGDEW